MEPDRTEFAEPERDLDLDFLDPLGETDFGDVDPSRDIDLDFLEPWDATEDVGDTDLEPDLERGEPDRERADCGLEASGLGDLDAYFDPGEPDGDLRYAFLLSSPSSFSTLSPSSSLSLALSSPESSLLESPFTAAPLSSSIGLDGVSS